MRLRLVAVVLFGSLVYASVPLQVVQWTALVAVMLTLVSAVWSRAGRTRLEIIRHEPESAMFRFQRAEVHIELRNHSRFPLAHLSLSDPCGNLRASGSTHEVMSLRAGERRHMRYTVRGMNRGVHTVGPLRVRGTDPLGLFPWSESLGIAGTISVYPALYPVDIGWKRGVPAGNLATANPIYEDTTRFRSLRAYVRGDDPRRISWKASARTGELKTLEYLPALSFPVVVLLNLRAESYETRKRFHATERCIEAAAAIIVRSQRLGQSVGLSVDGELAESRSELPVHSFPPEHGYAHAVSLLRHLAQCRSGEGVVDISALRRAAGSLPYGTRIYYVGPALTPEDVIALSAVARGETTLDLLYVRRQSSEHPPFIPAAVAVHSIPEHGAFTFVA